MTVSAAVAEDVTSEHSGWTSRRWAPVVMAVALLVFVGAPARVWLLAAAHSVGDSTVPGNLLVLWMFLGLLPLAVGVLSWLALRRRPAGRRFVVAALWACGVGLLTMFPITPYVFAF